MFCTKCRAQFTGNFCPVCGQPAPRPLTVDPVVTAAPQPSGARSQQTLPPQKSLESWQVVLIALGCFLGTILLVVMMMAFAMFALNKPSDPYYNYPGSSSYDDWYEKSLKAFEKIENGKTYTQVYELLGGPGGCIASYTDTGDQKMVSIYIWYQRWESSSESTPVIVVFKDDQVIEKYRG